MEFRDFDVSDYLTDEASIAEYLAATLEEESSGAFLKALGHGAKACGMAQISTATGLGRESLYKALTGDAQPRYDTIRRVVEALGLRITITPAHGTRAQPISAMDIPLPAGLAILHPSDQGGPDRGRQGGIHNRKGPSLPLRG